MTWSTHYSAFPGPMPFRNRRTLTRAAMVAGERRRREPGRHSHCSLLRARRRQRAHSHHKQRRRPPIVDTPAPNSALTTGPGHSSRRRHKQAHTKIRWEFNRTSWTRGWQSSQNLTDADMLELVAAATYPRKALPHEFSYSTALGIHDRKRRACNDHVHAASWKSVAGWHAIAQPTAMPSSPHQVPDAAALPSASIPCDPTEDTPSPCSGSRTFPITTRRTCTSR